MECKVKHGGGKNFLFKIGASITVCVCMILLYTVFGYTLVNPVTISPHATTSFRTRGVGRICPHCENKNLIQRSSLPRYHNSIPSYSEGPTAKFYSIWHDEPIVRKSPNYRKIVGWNSSPKWPPVGKACRAYPECVFTKDRSQVADADAVMFRGNRDFPFVYNRSLFPTVRHRHQYWIWHPYESPPLTRGIDHASYSGIFNWTFTYRNDSDILAAWGHITVIYRELAQNPPDPNRDYSKGKTKLVLWYVSNCYRYLTRLRYTAELRKHIQVDIFGGCAERLHAGTSSYCERRSYKCFEEHARPYKFYLAFENYKCVEYITEKFWDNSLKYDMVPVVLGATKSDYERFGPPNSFIHVDDFESPEQLADYLKYLDQNDDEYNRYFAWKTRPPKNLPPSWEERYCEVCKKLLQASPTERKVYTDLDRWWKGENYELCEPVVYDGRNPNDQVAT